MNWSYRVHRTEYNTLSVFTDFASAAPSKPPMVDLDRQNGLESRQKDKLQMTAPDS